MEFPAVYIREFLNQFFTMFNKPRPDKRNKIHPMWNTGAFSGWCLVPKGLVWDPRLSWQAFGPYFWLWMPEKINKTITNMKLLRVFNSYTFTSPFKDFYFSGKLWLYWCHKINNSSSSRYISHLLNVEF